MAKIIKSFKYLFIILFIASLAYSAQVEKSLTFEFEQANPEAVLGWYLYMADSADGQFQKVVDANGMAIRFVKQDDGGIYQASNSFTIEGSAGTTVTKFFKITAFGDDNGTEVESGLSNSASHGFKIPLNLQIPVLIKVTES